MLRVILVIFTMFLLPFAIYIAYQFMNRIDDGKPGGAVLESMPLIPLALAGTLLVALTLAVTATISDKNQGTYEPAVIVNGKVQPGRIK